MTVPILNMLLLISILVLVVFIFIRLPMSSEDYSLLVKECKDIKKESECKCGKTKSSNGNLCAWDGTQCKADKNWPAGTFPC